MRPSSRTLGALIDELAAARPDADAIVFPGERLTFAALRDRSDAIARAFLAVGVRKDDRIAILLPNRPEWLITAFAAAKVGAVSVAISTFSTAREIAWTLEHAQPTVVVTMEAFRGRGYLRAIHAVCPELGRAAPGMLQSERLPELRAVVSIDERRHDGVYAWADLLERATEVRATALAAAPVGRDPLGPRDRAARGRRDDDGGGQRAAALQRLRRDGDVWQLRGDRCPRLARAAPHHAGASAAGDADPRRRAGERPPAAAR